MEESFSSNYVPEASAASKEKPDWLRPALLFLISVALGVCLIIWHKEITIYLAIALAAAVAVLGIVELILFLKNKEVSQPFTIGRLCIAMTLIAIGIFLCILPQVLIEVLPFALSCAIIFIGFLTLQASIDLVRMKVKKWFIPLIFGVVIIVCGFLGLINQIWNGKEGALMLFLGIVLCVEGITQIVSYFLFCFKKKQA